MAADGYIRIAITELHNAVADMQQQMDQLRRQIDTQKQQLQDEIKQLERERVAHGCELSHLNSTTEKTLAMERMHQIARDCDDKRGQMSRLDSDLSNVLQRKMLVFNDLKDIAQKLDMLMASPDIR
jgi:flagellar biosynthesis/type III secretory pathway protein FliH